VQEIWLDAAMFSISQNKTIQFVINYSQTY